MEEIVGGETELGERVEPGSSPGHAAQQELEQLKTAQLSSKADTGLSPPLIAIKKGKGANNDKYFVLVLYGKELQEQNEK